MGTNRQLRVIGIVGALFCAGFRWPGDLSRITDELHSSEVETRRLALTELGDYPADEIRELLLKALEDDDLGARIEAARTVQRVGLGEAAQVLTRWLKAPEPEMRAVAASALARLSGASVTEALIALLGDSHVAVRAAAIEALRVLGTPQAAAALRERLESVDRAERVLRIKALAHLRDQKALESFIRASRERSPS
jgi:HEAT repeat protein